MPAAQFQPAIFLDRDGTLNAAVVRDGKPYPPASVEEFELLNGTAKACAQLKDAGYRLVVATNQPDVGRGTQSQESVERIHQRLNELIPQIDLIQVCYHGGAQFGQPCDCRKPKPAMLLNAAHQLKLDLGGSWMIGDRWRDIDCGKTAGCRTIFIDRGYREKLHSPPDFVVHSFSEVIGIILAQS